MPVDLCRFRAFAGLLREAGHDLVEYLSIVQSTLFSLI